MSLLDAFINDPPPGEVWIAVRPREFSGSGTEADPYNGATINGSSVAISSFTLGSLIPGTNLTTVTVSTAPLAHNLSTGDIARIEGTTDYRFNASFPVTYVSATVFTCTVWAIDPAAPVPTGGTCRKDPYLFDAVRRKLQAANVPVRVRLGPGVFETKGYGVPADQISWRPISGMKIIVSGIGETTLKLVGAYYDDRVFNAVGTLSMNGSAGAVYARIDDFEISDLTIDCDHANQPSTNVTCAAVFIRGNRTRIRRIRVINFGRGSVLQECFPIGVCAPSYEALPASAEAIDCRVENCIVESPSTFGAKESTCIMTFAGIATIGVNAGLAPFPLGVAIRECYIDCDHQRNPVENTVDEALSLALL